MKIELKEGTSQRIAQLFQQMQNVQVQIGERVDNILLTVCEEHDIDIKKFAPKITEDFKTLVFEEIPAQEEEENDGIYQMNAVVEENVEGVDN